MRFYRALLHLYPAAFRVEYGGEMLAVVHRRHRDAPGWPARAALWAGIVAETLANAAAAHADILRQDFRYAGRSLARSPGFAAAVILIAALGIGANTAVFSITDHVIIRPLPFAGADRLVKLWEDDASRGYLRNDPSPANYRDWRSGAHVFEVMAAYFTTSVNMIGRGDPQRLDGASVTADLFPMLGVQPALGRTFTPEDDRAGAPGTLILSDRLWRAAFGGNPSVLGQRVRLGEDSYVVVGVMPATFHFPARDIELWTPARFGPSDFEDRTDTYLRVVARLRPGVTIDQARAEMGVIAARLAREFPKENARVGVTITRLRDEVSEQGRLLLLALVGAAACVLLIACTNLSHLLLARALARRYELAVRTVLGAGRERLVRQLFTESLVFAVAGGVLGVAAAAAVLPLLARLVPTSLPIAEVPALDARVLLFALAVTAITGVGFGVLPGVRACRDAGVRDLRETARGGTGVRHARLRGALVIAEVAASVVLLVSTGLLLRALWRLQVVDPGFRPSGVLTLRTTLPWPKYAQTVRRCQFYDQVLSEVRALPGVSGAGYTSFLPMVMRGGIWGVTLAGRAAAETRSVSLRFVTPGFFDAMGIPLRLGREVRDSDTLASPMTAVVSESFVRQFWPGENPIGKRFTVAFAERTIAGVVGDVRVRGLERESEPQVYLPPRQVPDGSLMNYAPKDLVIRASGDPRALVPAVRRIIARVDPEQAVANAQMLDEIVDAERAPRAVQVRVLGGFAALACLLAATGIHALLSFALSTRTREIGVRVALGAGRRDILAMMLGQSLRHAAIGLALGLAIALATSQAMRGLLFGVEPADAGTLLVATGLALVMTLAGTLVPAFRALRVNPVVAMRVE